MKVFISLSDTVKSKIKNKFNMNMENFIEKEFPQDKDLNCYFFKYKGQKDSLIGLKVSNSNYLLLIKRVEKNGYWESYFIAIDIQKREDIIMDKHNLFLNIKTELKIPILFNKNYEKDSDKYWELAKKINNSVSRLNQYQVNPEQNIKIIEQKKSNLNEQIITISLGNRVKEKIQTKFKSNIEDFIEKEFPQDKDLDIYMFKYLMGSDEKIALKSKNSNYMLVMERSTNYQDRKDNYMFCFDIQKREEIEKDEENEFITKRCELKIPVEFNRNLYNNSTVELLDDIEKQFHYIKPYKIQSLEENEEFKKWYVYLTLLEKIIDTKDFYIEADISYTDKKAKVNISHLKDKELLEKIKKARSQNFLYYQIDEVDISKPIHEWDEKDNRNRNFGVLRNNQQGILQFDLDDDFIKKFKTKNDKEIIANSYDTNDFIVKSRQYIEKSLRDINKNIVYRDKSKTQINVANSIMNLKIEKDKQEKIITIWNALSDKNHNKNAKDIDKNEVNDILLLLGKNNKESFNPPSKLILRVSYFRDQFQLRTLKKGLEQIQRHPLKAYLFGNKKIDKISQDEVDNFEIEFLSKVLNDRQKESITKALISKDIFMIQGPPGTGKTEVISEIAYQEAIRGKKVLITSQANMAVDNAIARLNHPSLYPVRIIRKDYEPEDGEILPIEENIATFYQDRIISNLSKELQENKNEYSQIQNDFLEELKDDENQDIEEERGYLKSYYLKNINIYGATLFETGKYSFKDKEFDVVIVDEVSKAMPPELVLPILKANKLILVGDHKQLPPILSNELSLEDVAKESGIELKSLDFETTVFEKLISNNPDSFVMLNTQYRMHPDIQMVINQFYRDNNSNGLECGLANPDIEKSHNIKDGIFLNKHLIWLKTKESAKEERVNTSFKNKSEVQGIKQTLGFLDKEYKKQNIIPTVGVITFYATQLGELRRLEKGGFWNLEAKKRNYPNLDLRFGTVDRFQGQERDIIIVSLVRNNKEHNIGFAKKPNRVNVAFSRAKKLLIIVGNADNFTYGRDEKSSKVYKEIFNIAKKFGTVKGL